MLTDPKLRSQVDALWDKFWTGDLTPVPSPKGDGCLLAKVNVLPLDALGDDVRDVLSTGGEELRSFFGRTLMPSVLDRAFRGEL